MTATAPDTDAVTFVPAQGTLRIEQYVAPIDLSANRTTVEPGESVRFTATRTDTGTPVPGQLTAGDRTLWLDRNGTATVTFDDPGVVGVTARRANTTTHHFPADTLNVTVEDTRYSVTDFQAPSSVERGQSATARATVENVGSDSGNATVTYRFDGETGRTTVLELELGQSRTVSFDVPTDVAAEEYEHGIASRDERVGASITVESSSEE